MQTLSQLVRPHCEIEFLPVGEGSRAGDAIVIRYGTVEQYELMVVDGGDSAAGDRLVRHLEKYFPKQLVEHVVLTHSDIDHASGLRNLLGAVPVRNLWLHVPWLHAEYSRGYFLDKNGPNLEKLIRDEYDVIAEIVEIAQSKGCTIQFPFSGTRIGPFLVTTPTQHFYEALLPQFDRTPEPDEELLRRLGMWVESRKPSIFQAIMAPFLDKAAATVQQWVDESWNTERLKDRAVTSASNESSVVLYGDFSQGPVLLTGDAGVTALDRAAQTITAFGHALQKFEFVQIPHHGSRSNVGPTILNRLLGPILPENSETTFTAYVSAPKDDVTHPRKMVTNAFRRRGAKVIATQGWSIVHAGGFPSRDDYVAATPMAFASQVEDYS